MSARSLPDAEHLARRARDRVAQPAHLRAQARPVRPLAGVPARVPGELRRRAVRLGELPGFRFPAGYTAFQFVFVLCQSSMFAGLFTGFSLAFDFESGFARRLMLAAEDRRGIALGYALVALTRATMTLTVVTSVALIAGMRITGDGVDVFGLYGLPRCSCSSASAGRRAWRSASARSRPGPLMQTPVFLICSWRRSTCRSALLKGWIHEVASVNPATAFLDAGRGLISGVHDHTAWRSRRARR